MRFFNLVAILALGRVSAEVSYAVAPNLRGSEPKVDEDRDLNLVAVSFSKSASFNFNCCYRGNYCMDMRAYCMKYATTDVDTQTISNSVAESEFYAAAVCGALADTHACSIACVKAKGNINLNATVDIRYGMNLNLKMQLTQATLTVAEASSEAAASAFSSAAGQVYTGTDGAFCGGEGKGSPQCSPGAVKALANASALAFGDAFAMADATANASSGTSSNIAAWVNAKGASIKHVSAFVTTVAQSWSFAATSTNALASVFVAVLANATAISLQCGNAYEMYCSTGECQWQNQTEACDAAIAFGSGNATAYAESCANASASAVASTKVVMNFGGQIGGFKNDGKKLTMEFPNGKNAATGAAAAICPGK